MAADIDTTPVECPSGCFLTVGSKRSRTVPRQFRWVDEAIEDVGTRNYCEHCGAALVEATDPPVTVAR